MKTFTEYLAESVKEHEFVIKVAGILTDNDVNIIENTLSRFDPIEISSVKKTIMQEHPLDFSENVVNTEVSIVEVKTAMPVSHDTLKRTLADHMGIPVDNIIVRQPNDPRELENAEEVLRMASKEEDYEPYVGSEYDEEESIKTNEPIYGEEHKKSFLAKLQKNKEESAAHGKVEVENALMVDDKTDAKSSKPEDVKPDTKNKAVLNITAYKAGTK